MIEIDSKGFCALVTPVVINEYTQVLLKRDPHFSIFFFAKTYKSCLHYIE